MRFNNNPYAQQPQQDPSDLFPSLWGDQEEFTRAASSCLAKVFARMFVALLVTAAVSYSVFTYPLPVAGYESLQHYLFSNTAIIIALVIAQFALVIVLSARVTKMSPAISTFMFFFYAALTGVTLSVIFLSYNLGLIFQAFIVTAMTFAAMAIYGTITQRDLTRIGSLCFMGLIGIIIASIVNLIFPNDFMTVIVNYIGILVFVGLTAYDTQNIKRMLHEASAQSHEEAIKQISVIGALKLYLNFINLFLRILSIMGRRR
jgi:hypothetical protein